MIGVLGGGVLTGAVQFANALAQRRWTRQDAADTWQAKELESQRAREDRERERLFEHKKDAHAVFLKVLDDLESAVRSREALTSGVDYARKVGDAKTNVALFGSEATQLISSSLWVTARGVVSAASNAQIDHTSCIDPAQIEDVILKAALYRAAAREDLGVDPPGSGPTRLELLDHAVTYD